MSESAQGYVRLRPIIETCEGTMARASDAVTMEAAHREAERMNRTAERMGLKTRYRVRCSLR